MADAKKIFQTLVSAWPVLIFVTLVFTTLFTAFFDPAVARIADARIGALVPTSKEILELTRGVADLNNKAITQAATTERIEAQSIRIEGKLDNFILLSQQRGG